METAPQPSDSMPQIQEASPLPPPAPLSPARLRAKVRIWCLLILAITLPLIAVAAYMKPSPAGTGTHTQLGLPECGFYKMTGVPCMTCGCTTAVTHVVHGQLLSGFITQPFGAVFGVATIMAALLALIGVATGKWYGPEPFWITWHWQPVLFGILGLLVLAWGYKVAFVTLAHG